MPGFMSPPLDQQMMEAEKQKEYIESWKRQNKEDPPKNILHAAGRSLLRLMFSPRDPRTY